MTYIPDPHTLPLHSNLLVFEIHTHFSLIFSPSPPPFMLTLSSLSVQHVPLACLLKCLAWYYCLRVCGLWLCQLGPEDSARTSPVGRPFSLSISWVPCHAALASPTANKQDSWRV